MIAWLPNSIFVILLLLAVGFFTKNVRQIIKNIKLGKDIDRSDQSGKRWSNMARIALGQSQMVKRPIAGILHIVVYVGFILINIKLYDILLRFLIL